MDCPMCNNNAGKWITSGQAEHEIGVGDLVVKVCPVCGFVARFAAKYFHRKKDSK